MMNYAGAEKKYMGKLESIKTEMTELSTKPAKTLLYRLSIVSCIVAVVFCLLLIGMVVLQHREAAAIERQDREYEKDLVKRIAWEDEVFPKLDALYEQGDYDSILAMRDSFYEDESEYDIGGWRHAAFIEVYDDYATLLRFRELSQTQDEVESYYYGEVLYNAMNLWCFYSDEKMESLIPQHDYNANWGLTESEVELVRSYRQTAFELMTNDLKLTQADVDYLSQQGEDHSLVNTCYDFAEDRFGEESP
jgi:preprotein translocase subunit SecG